MSLPIAMFLALLAQDVSAGDEVVVVAKRGRCDMRIADRLLGDREFTARAAEWAAGRPVRILVDDTPGYRCMAKIMFRLHERGVTRAVFVRRQPQP